MRQRPVILLVRKQWAYGVATLLLLIVLTGSITFTGVLSTGMESKIIVIDAGHGGQDPGAQHGGVKEKDINLDIALRLKSVLEAKGSTVILTRNEDRDFYLPGYVKGRMAKRVELNHRISIATTHNADLFISIHANSFPRNNSYGMETYYHLQSSAGKVLAERIQTQLGLIQGDNKRLAKAGDYYIINQTKMPAVIVEVGFLSNPRERKMLGNEEYRDSIAQAIGSGVEDFFNDFPFGVQETAPAIASQKGPAKVTENTFNLYYPSDNLETLVAEQCSVDSLYWESLKLAEKGEYILNQLIHKQRTKHPTPLPDSSQVLGLSIQNGVATVNFNDRLRADFPGGALEEDMAIKSIVWSLAQLSGIQGVRILIDGQFGDSIGGHVLLDHTFTASQPKGKVAIVIDDFGINNEGLADMLNLNIPITAAVMPNLMFSTQEAELLHQKGFEIILHMPMEAKNAQPQWLGPGAILTNQSNGEIHSKLQQGLASVRYASGISNHMGSRATENKHTVKAIVSFAQENGLYILDSKTSEQTILAQEALRANVPASTRDIFLDNSNDVTSIKRQLRLLIDKAKRDGQAIAIGHVGPQGPHTAQAIREMLPEFAKEGIQIVPLSELFGI